jgi:hypothetical protein
MKLATLNTHPAHPCCQAADVKQKCLLLTSASIPSSASKPHLKKTPTRYTNMTITKLALGHFPNTTHPANYTVGAQLPLVW